MSTPEQATDAVAPVVEAITTQVQPEQQQKQQKPKKEKQQKPKAAATDASASLGVQAKKSEDFSKWYSQLVVRSELIDYYDISGCYILRPWAYEIWELITAFLDGEFKKLGVKNASFPLLVPKRNLEKEEDHIEGFAAEVAWVTHSGSTKLEEPVAIRPTSETIMYPAFSKWIHSHRDLPLRLNQWCNVLRWEFKDPTPFIRSREFLWQEGHTAYAKKEDADAEVYKILDIYEAAYEEVLACSVIKGHKTSFEKFAGGNFTTTVEGYIPGSGRGIQAATSHSLGQNFAKMFDVSFQDENGATQYVWQNSWGFTTRSIGVMLMTHSDDKGLVLPPRIAPTQVVLIPIVKADNAAAVGAAVEKLYEELKAKGIRCEIDDRTNVSPGFKYNHYELKGVPIRVEVGARDLEKQSAVLARRDLGTKSFVQWEGFADSVQQLLNTIQQDMRQKSKKQHLESIATAHNWEQFMESINKNHLALIPWCGATECEQAIKVKSGESAKDAGADRSGAAKALCIPFKQPEIDVKEEKCLHCAAAGDKWVLFGRSY